jgi:RNA polymerase sigma-70 factor, ECF subfamily
MTAHSPSKGIVLRAQTGEREALDEVLREIGPRLLRYVTRVTGDVASAEDVVQETFLAIVRKIAWLSDPALFSPWAYRIASRLAFRALRRRRLLPSEPLLEESMEQLALQHETAPDPWVRERLLASIERLSPASRAVITLHYLEELPLSEVAAILDLPTGTVKSRLAYGLTQLRKEST